MNKTRYVLFALFIIGLFTVGCEDEGLNESDIMQVSQKASLAVQVLEHNTNRPIYGAKVTLTASGEVLTMNSDSSGMAYFSGLSEQDDARIKVVKDGYFLYSASFDIAPKYRSAGEFLEVYLNSTENAAIMKGVVYIQTDLTTEEPEHPSGIEIKALNTDKEILATALTNGDGEYELKIPVGSGRSIYISFPTLQYDQTLKVRDTSNTVVSTTAKGTIFDPHEVAEPVPNTSNVIATVNQPSTTVSGGNYYTASVKSLTITAGSITGIQFGYLGQGYTTTENISITSLDGGSGANIACSGNSTGSNTEPYYPVDPGSVVINSGGTGYPVLEPNENVYTISPSGFKWEGSYYYYDYFINNKTKYFNPGEVYVQDLDYGTGTTTGDIPVDY